MARPEPTPDELKALTTQLINRAGSGSIQIPVPDREDVAQETMLRLVKETPREGAPALPIRAFATLRQVKVDWLRKRKRTDAVSLESVEDPEALAREDAERRLAELCDVVKSVAGPDALAIAEARALGMTESETGKLPGWTENRAHAARRRLKRAGERIRGELLDD